jgi:hypothetical protein
MFMNRPKMMTDLWSELLLFTLIGPAICVVLVVLVAGKPLDTV